MEILELKSSIIEMENAQEQIQDVRRKNWWTLIYINSIYPIWRTERKKNEEIWTVSQDLWITMKHVNICLMGVSEDEREKGEEKIFE